MTSTTKAVEMSIYHGERTLIEAKEVQGGVFLMGSRNGTDYYDELTA